MLLSVHVIAGLVAIVVGYVALLVIGDLRVVVHGPLQGQQRPARPLSRMYFAMFIATGSFFLGQMKVFPEPLRHFPLLAIPAFLPLVLMVDWLRFRERSHRVGPLAAARSV
jgi:hypothetical protein